MPWFDYVKGIVHGYLGGQAGASAMMNVLIGKVCPSGKLNETYPLHYEDTPAFHYYPSKERRQPSTARLSMWDIVIIQRSAKSPFPIWLWIELYNFCIQQFLR